MARRRAFIRAVLGGAAALALALALGGVTAAAAEDPVVAGSISGTVVRDDDGTPVAGVTVSADGPTGASVTTDSTGTYTLPNLAAGSYVVSFFPEGTDLKREYWKDASDYSQAIPVVVGEGEAVSAIDASLVQGGSIQGIVTREDDGSAIAGAEVQALDSNNEIVAAATAGASGEYILGGLPAGSYRVRFASSDAELLPEYWKDAYGWDAATLITVTEPQGITDIDASLAEVGYISGTVTRSASDEPLSASVAFYAAGTGLDVFFVDTNSDGTFRIPVVAGTYRVLFHSNERGIMEEYWKDAFLWENATLLTVAPGEEVAGIDAALGKPAQITGTVTIDSDAADDVRVEAWSNGTMVNDTRADPVTGAYSLTVPHGTYILKASPTFSDGTTTAKPQFFDGVATAAEATPVSVLEGEAISGIDFALTVDTTPEVKPTLTLSAGSIRAGKDITISGTGFAPGATIAFELHSDPITLGTLTADADGVLQGTLRIPASAPTGAHTLVALSGTTVLASTALTVTAAAGTGTGSGGQTGGATAPGGGLASTGADAPIAIVAIGVLLAVMGGMLVRRRRVES
ncbi:MSCRAMM family protein [Microbacterium maritypicum]|uniref:MSCRAMM family protein n=1 Tax=Microbacterium maritypicum TaxID=33918 RepID=UPI00380F5397